MTAALPAALRALLGPAGLREGAAAAALDPGWHPDNLGAGLVALPATTAEAQTTVRLCAEHGASVVPQGGRTGLVGGAVSAPGQVILSTARMDRILKIDPDARIAVVEAGATLQAVQAAAAAHGLQPGIDLPSRGSATIGGMIAVNAGGIMAFRNGVMRHQVLGLEAVLPDGGLYADMTRVVKNTAGYDLKHLFIGAEGTLGLVTRAVLRLEAAPAAQRSALLSLPGMDAAQGALRAALRPAAGELRAAEAMWRPFLRATAAAQGWSDPGLDMDAPMFLLLSLGGRDPDALEAALAEVFEAVAAR